MSGLKEIVPALVPKGTMALHDVESLTSKMVWALKRTTFMSFYK